MYITERPCNLQLLSFFCLYSYKLPFKICCFISLKVTEDQPNKRTFLKFCSLCSLPLIFSSLQ